MQCVRRGVWWGWGLTAVSPEGIATPIETGIRPFPSPAPLMSVHSETLKGTVGPEPLLKVMPCQFYL